jgi:3-methylfumaryl-CoA hydratase
MMNSHRIHYDRPYVTGTEGYPGLLVHGPLIATLLLDLFRRMLPEAKLCASTTRAVSPLYDIADFTVEGAPEEGGGAKLWALNSEGSLAMSIDLKYENA